MNPNNAKFSFTVLSWNSWKSSSVECHFSLSSRKDVFFPYCFVVVSEIFWSLFVYLTDFPWHFLINMINIVNFARVDLRGKFQLPWSTPQCECGARYSERVLYYNQLHMIIIKTRQHQLCLELHCWDLFRPASLRVPRLTGLLLVAANYKRSTQVRMGSESFDVHSVVPTRCMSG